MLIPSWNHTGLRLLLGITLAVTTYLSVTPRPATLPDIAFADKWAHAATYLLLALLADASWPELRFGVRKWGPLFLYSLLIEVIQSQIPNRLFSIADLAANAAGIGFYGVIARPLLRGRWLR